MGPAGSFPQVLTINPSGRWLPNKRETFCHASWKNVKSGLLANSSKQNLDKEKVCASQSLSLWSPGFLPGSYGFDWTALLDEDISAINPVLAFIHSRNFFLLENLTTSMFCFLLYPFSPHFITFRKHYSILHSLYLVLCFWCSSPAPCTSPPPPTPCQAEADSRFWMFLFVARHPLPSSQPALALVCSRLVRLLRYSEVTSVTVVGSAD